MLSQRKRIEVWIVALLTISVGIINLISVVTPSSPERLHWLEQIFPFEITTGAHLFAAMSGFFLLTLGMNLLRRKHQAWLLTIGLLMVSILSNLFKGWDYEESILSALLLGKLLLMRGIFTARSDQPSIFQGIRVLMIALFFTLAYGTLGFFWLAHHYATSFSLQKALIQTLAIFFTDDNMGLHPISRFGSFFIDSIYIIGAVTIIYALWMLLRPVLPYQQSTLREKQQARKIVEQYGNSYLARFTLLDDKSYYFSPSGQSVIAYVPKGIAAIALGDPIGPKEDLEEAIFGYKQFCYYNDWQPAFYQTLPDNLALYESLSFKNIKIGEEAIVNLKKFTLQGKASKNLRNTINKFTKLGYVVRFYQPPIGNELLTELQAISNEWLKQVEGSEKKFSLGWFENDYVRNCEIAVVENAQGNPVAFANIVPEYQINEITIDLIRHLAEVEKGTLDFLFISMFQHFQELGYNSFNLGLAALSGVGEAFPSSHLERGIHYLYKHLNQFYHFQGLRSYKDKFNPHWESRYLVYPHFATLPEVVMGLVRADSDDRLLDYLGTSFFSTTVIYFFQQLKKLAPIILSISLFSFSVWVILQELHKHSIADVLKSFDAIPKQNILWAIFLTCLNYITLTGYDVLAVKFVRQPLSYPRIALVSIISYGVSNSVGLALLSGSAIRYRFYSAWGFSAGKIAQIIAFCNISFWLGLFAIGGAIFAFQSLPLPKQLHLPFSSIQPIGFIFLAIITCYLLWSSLSHKTLTIKNFQLPYLSLKFSLTQIGITSIDWILTAAVLYTLLPISNHLPFLNFFGIYLLAELGGIISNVPGGLGVLESVLILFLSPQIPLTDLLGSLLAYRGIYYFLPLISSMLMLGLYELKHFFEKNQKQS